MKLRIETYDGQCQDFDEATLLAVLEKVREWEHAEAMEIVHRTGSTIAFERHAVKRFIYENEG
jgi:hypothetical protein